MNAYAIPFGACLGMPRLRVNVNVQACASAAESQVGAMASEEARRVPARSDGQTAARRHRYRYRLALCALHEVDALNVFPVPTGDTGFQYEPDMRAAARTGMPRQPA